ncbi:MAG TPA: tetratricopeptide repeat protein, partial [Polyangiales bacterium]
QLGALSAAPATAGELALERKLALDAARVRFALAQQLAPHLPAARLAHAEAIAEEEPRAAVTALAELRTLAPLYEAERVAALLGSLHARLGAYQEARAEYERALSMHCSDGPPSALLIALAQIVMFQGDLPSALTLYERALRDAEPNERIRAMWGRAVALDRAGDHAAALTTARRALAEDRFDALRTMTFVPAFEHSYYHALRALAQGQPAQALVSFRQYLAADAGPFVADAREHLAALDSK